MNDKTVERVACAIYDALEADKDSIYLGRFGDGDAVVIDGYVNLLVCAEAAIKAHNKAVCDRLPPGPFPGMPHGTKEASNESDT